MAETEGNGTLTWKGRVHQVIFEADTQSGKAFDIGLMVAILLSVAAVMLDSVADIRRDYGAFLNAVEWFFTFVFMAEYLLRLWCLHYPVRYALSFFGIVDFLSIIPSFLSLFLAGGHYLLVIRLLRILRVFRVFKLIRYVGEARLLVTALRASGRKILVFLFAVLTMVIIFGSLMYLVEGEENGFRNIPISIYWAIVTLTTVGYGDITPQTDLGRIVASLIMITGYAIIAVPTGIVTVELSRAQKLAANTQSCQSCGGDSHADDALYCQYCGVKLDLE